jgi:cholest-4-en-3-one 26-monooxygenase
MTDPYDLSLEVFQRREHHDVFARMRAEDPVHHYVDEDGFDYWCLTKHADVQMANRDIETFEAARGFSLIDKSADPIQLEMMSQILPGLDPDRHTRFRRIVNRGFTPRTLRLIEDHLALKARRIVDEVIDLGECEFVEDIAAALPLEAICELVGVRPEDRRMMYEWGNVMTGLDDPNIGDNDAGMVASAEMLTYANQLRAKRLTEPRDDIVTKLTDADIDAEGLTEAEFGMFFLLLVVAGNETTRNATTHGMRALIEHPGQLDQLRLDPSRQRVERAVEEILRWSTPVLYFRRTATRDVELRGKTIKAGDRVVLWYASANRDEEAFVEPFTFDLARWPNDHLTFGGGGPHFCLGANLARMELRLIFTELVTRMTDLELAGPVEMVRSNFVAGVSSMPIRWKAPT